MLAPVALSESVMTHLPAPGRPLGDTSAESIVRHAGDLLDVSHLVASRRERRQQRRLAAVVADPALRDLSFALTDEVLRFDDDISAARRFRAIVSEDGVPRSLGRVDRWSLAIGARLAPIVPRLVMPLVRSRVLREANGVVRSADDRPFTTHVARRRAEGCAVNVNVLGEAILSDAEADDRMAMLRLTIARPDVTYVSLKISAICANLEVLAFEHSVGRICERLRELYRCAEAASRRTFVNLDMEEHRDLPLTIAALRRVLDEPEFAGIDAGIVLQAYLPQSHRACQELCEWALARHARGGARLKIRVVKGANLAMERVDAELHGWPLATYSTKLDVDASFKQLILFALDGRFAAAVRVGVASHNLFDVAWALSLGQRERIDIEMLEGMAPAQARVVRDAAGGLLLYTPVVHHDDLPASIAYLARRLDENTAPDNFLRALFTLEVGTAEWDEQSRRFVAAVRRAPFVSTTSNRVQDRSLPGKDHAGEPFTNAADTDWTVAANRNWIAGHLAMERPAPAHPMITTVDGIDAVVRRAAGASWATTSWAERRAVLLSVAEVMERERGDTLATMAVEAGKSVLEGDPEVSEAVDFARYYASSTHALEGRAADGASFSPLGVVVVASPWNFPYAIPAGGVLAALAAGCSVVLKPAPEVRGTAQLLAEQLWRGGVPHDVLQVVACPDNQVGRHLVTHPSVAAVVLTGAYDTAAAFLDWKPSMRLMAETSGKNAMVITAAADEDAALRDLVRSAFGHAGQKCSAASLAIVDGALFDDPSFRARLAAAVRSVRVGAAGDPATMMGPLIAPPSGPLARALTVLDDGEEWLVRPQPLDETDLLWSPGVRWGVRPGSWFHRTECFGPVLGVIRAADLADAIRIQNGTDYGLTGGIQSLDEHEVAVWLESVEVGNAYVNRHMTGAIVQRQPFGGWKRSSVGCGPKAGGPSYVEAFGTWSGGVDGADEFERVWRGWFQVDHDPSALRSEHNILRYRPLDRVALVIGAGEVHQAVAVARIAAATTGVDLIELDAGSAAPSQLVADAAGSDRVRVIGAVGDDIRRSLRAGGFDLDDAPPVADAPSELRHWVREQSISRTRHRHGRLLD